MKYRSRIYYTETDKALMWDRWAGGADSALKSRLDVNDRSPILIFELTV
jgi:hypothetical protein